MAPLLLSWQIASRQNYIYNCPTSLRKYRNAIDRYQHVCAYASPGNVMVTVKATPTPVTANIRPRHRQVLKLSSHSEELLSWPEWNSSCSRISNISNRSSSSDIVILFTNRSSQTTKGSINYLLNVTRFIRLISLQMSELIL